MVARFHEGCLHRRVDGQIEEFIFTEASAAAVASWARQVEQMMASPECPDTARWLVDLRLSGPLPLAEVALHLEKLRHVDGGGIGEHLRIAYLTDAPDVFENLFHGISRLFHFDTRFKWFGSNGMERRPQAITWLMQNG